MRFWRILLEPQGGEGGTPEPKVEAKAPDLSRAAEGLVAKHGSHDAALLVLLGETHGYRDKLRDVQAKLPPEGAVVLTGDDAKHWGHYKALGAPGDVKKALDEGTTAKGEVGAYRKKDLTATAAKLTRIDGGTLDPEVLGTLAEKLDLVIDDLKDDKGNLVGEDGKPLAKDGVPVRAAFVKGEGDKLTGLAAYARANWAKFLPSLKVAQGSATTKVTPTGPGTGRPGVGARPTVATRPAATGGPPKLSF
jgi:hypothetical protein